MKGFPLRTMHPVLQLLVLLGLGFAGLCLASFLAVAVAMLGYGYSLASFGQLNANPSADPNGWAIMMLLQGLSLVGLGAGAALLPLVVRVRWAAYFSPRRLGAGWWLLGAAAVMLCSVPFMSGIIAWNANAHFPAALHGFEAWARAKEDQLDVLIKFLTQFNSVGRFSVALLVIAVVPAVAEELVFRGVVQQNLVRWFGSVHVGVWVGAALFSAFHMQFFGFVPRLVLGLLLGYLYAWSGNIVVSMAAHFTQNAFQLVLLYLAQRGQFGWGFDPDSTAALPWPLMLLSAALTAGLLWFLHQRLTAPARPSQLRTVGRHGVTAAP